MDIKKILGNKKKSPNIRLDQIDSAISYFPRLNGQKDSIVHRCHAFICSYDLYIRTCLEWKGGGWSNIQTYYESQYKGALNGEFNGMMKEEVAAIGELYKALGVKSIGI